MSDTKSPAAREGETLTWTKTLQLDLGAVGLEPTVRHIVYKQCATWYSAEKAREVADLYCAALERDVAASLATPATGGARAGVPELQAALTEIRNRTYSNDRGCALAAEAVADIADIAGRALAAPRPQAGGAPGAAYGIIDPDYARVFTITRCLAWQEGYAIAMHGSFTRDLDLLAVPWTERACEPEHLVRRILNKTGMRLAGDGPSTKPHDRLAWTLLFSEFGDPRFVDLSVLPRARETALTAPGGTDGEHTIALQRIIEALCKNNPLREDAAISAPWHAAMAAKHIAEVESRNQTIANVILSLRKVNRISLLPDCMMPDGAEPCGAFAEQDRALRQAITALEDLGLDLPTDVQPPQVHPLYEDVSAEGKAAIAALAECASRGLQTTVSDDLIAETGHELAQGAPGGTDEARQDLMKRIAERLDADVAELARANGTTPAEVMRFAKQLLSCRPAAITRPAADPGAQADQAANADSFFSRWERFIKQTPLSRGATPTPAATGDAGARPRPTDADLHRALTILEAEAEAALDLPSRTRLCAAAWAVGQALRPAAPITTGDAGAERERIALVVRDAIYYDRQNSEMGPVQRAGRLADIAEWATDAILAARATPPAPSAEPAATGQPRPHHPPSRRRLGMLARIACVREIPWEPGERGVEIVMNTGRRILLPLSNSATGDAGADRARIARIINPVAFNLGTPDYYGPDLTEGMYAAAQRDALAKADRILANRPPQAAPSADSVTAGQGDGASAAIRDVLAERRRQVEVEGWSPEHDDIHKKGQMARAAMAYACVAAWDPEVRTPLSERRFGSFFIRDLWPWAKEWWKPTTPRRDLVKAGALILAEIERLDRIASPSPSNAGGA